MYVLQVANVFKIVTVHRYRKSSHQHSTYFQTPRELSSVPYRPMVIPSNPSTKLVVMPMPACPWADIVSLVFPLEARMCTIAPKGRSP
jgi:hypothetical protein